MLLLVSVPTGRADGASAERWQVWFRGGRSVVASSVEPVAESGFVRVVLEGGGSITVPGTQLRRKEVLPVPPVLAPASPVPDRTPDLDETMSCDPLQDPRLSRWDSLLRSSAERHGVDSNLVRAVVAVESCGDASAVSKKGAVGLMQLLPSTAADYGCRDPRDAAANLDAGCRHLARLLDKLSGRLDLVLAAYNAGEGTVERVGGIPRYRETQRYVQLVTSHLKRLDEAARDDRS